MTGSEGEESTVSGDLDFFKTDMNAEIQLFTALLQHKPVGLNRHFQLLCIQQLLEENGVKDVRINQISAHLDRLYDMASLDETEMISFHECDFFLPEGEFGEYIERMKISVALTCSFFF